MSTEYFIIDLFCRIDDAMKDLNKHSQAILYPSEIVTMAILFAIKEVGRLLRLLRSSQRRLQRLLSLA